MHHHPLQAKLSTRLVMAKQDKSFLPNPVPQLEVIVTDLSSDKTWVGFQPSPGHLMTLQFCIKRYQSSYPNRCIVSVHLRRHAFVHDMTHGESSGPPNPELIPTCPH